MILSLVAAGGGTLAEEVQDPNDERACDVGCRAAIGLRSGSFEEAEPSLASDETICVSQDEAEGCEEAASGTGDARCHVSLRLCLPASVTDNATCGAAGTPFCVAATAAVEASQASAVSGTGSAQGSLDPSGCHSAQEVPLGLDCPPRADAGASKPCVPHPPIRITEEEGSQGFVLEDDGAQGPVYRPGSGVVAGQGTAEDPYVIEGWCITPAERSSSGLTLNHAIHIEDTEARVVVRDNAIEAPPPDNGDFRGPFEAGITVQDAAHVTIEDNHITGEALSLHFAIRVQGAEDIAIRGNEIVGVPFTPVADVRELVVEDNEFRSPSAPYAPFLAIGEAEDVRIEGNEGPQLYLGVCGAARCSVEDARIEDNDLDRLGSRASSGLVLRENRLEAGIRLQGGEPGHFLHDIDASNTVDGEPVRYLRGVDGVTVSEPAGQVIVAASTNVTVRDVHQTGSTLYGADSHGLTVEKTTVEADVAATIVRSSDVAIRNVTLDEAIVGLGVVASDGVLVEDTAISANLVGAWIDGGQDHRLRGNNVDGVRPDTDAVGVQADTAAPVDARGNWWGCPGGPGDGGCVDVRGNVDYVPWLREPNPEAGAD